MDSSDRRESGRAQLTFLGLVTVVAFLGCVLAGVVLAYPRLEGQAPEVRFDSDFETVGRAPSIGLTVEDVGTGLGQVRITLSAGGQDIVLADDRFDSPPLWPPFASGPQSSVHYEVGDLIADRYAIQEGPASIRVEAEDHAFRFFSGNRSELSRDFEFDLAPPRLEVLSGQHNISQGGSEFVVYRVSEDAEVSGVQVGEHFFPGYRDGASDPGVRFSLFAFPYDSPPDTPVRVVARDRAGNEAEATPSYRVAPRQFRRRQINVDDAFLEKVVPEILSHTPEIEDQGSLVDNYVEINSNLRRQNHASIRAFSEESAGEFLWSGAFLQLSNSQVESLFADRRTYMYEGKEIDQQDHVGFDLSVVEHYPIEAANDGRVILAGYFGIYGNTVLIDHGMGLISLYGHMSSIDVEQGQSVGKRQVLGRTGATGLAGGDHLHFGLFLHGVPVNPIEWWDGQWIQVHVLDRMAPFVSSEP